MGRVHLAKGWHGVMGMEGVASRNGTGGAGARARTWARAGIVEC